MTSQELLSSLTNSQLLSLFNSVSGKKVKRFADRKTALRRIGEMLKDQVLKPKVEAALGVRATTAVVLEEPLPTIAEALKEGLEKGAKRQGVPALADKKLRLEDAKPIEGSDVLVSIGGRVVRKENAKKIAAGIALWGKLGKRPSEADRLPDYPHANFNYKPKDKIKPIRPGSDREKLVDVMRKKGITPKEAAEMFSLDEDQAMYKIRDLHYTSGHGLELRKGRIYVTDKA